MTYVNEYVSSCSDYEDVFLDSAHTIDLARLQDPIIVTSGGVKKRGG